jgi:hypothetical protein
MIELLIFHLHILAALYAFTKYWQHRGFREGILAIMVIGLLFSIGWAMTGTLAHYIMPSKWNTPAFNQDTLSLIVLVIPEAFFFYHFILKDKRTEMEENKI